MQRQIDLKNIFHLYGSLLILSLTAAFVLLAFWDFAPPRKDFYNELWGPAHLLTRGQSPYNTASLDPELPAAWFPMAIGFFFPLGWLPEVPASKTWLVFNVTEICLILYLAQDKKTNLFDTAALAVMCFFLPFTINHLNLGQFSITATLCWLLSIRFTEKGNRWAPAFFIALALSKPHLGILPMLGISLREYQRGGFRDMLLSWARIAMMCLALSIPLFVSHPNWIPDAISSMSRNPSWPYPSLYIVFTGILASWGWPVWILTTSIVIALNFQLWKMLPQKTAIHWSFALAPLATPYIGSWDFVVLLPLLVSTYSTAARKGKLFLWAAYLAAWIAMARNQTAGNSHDSLFWWTPLWFVCVFALITDWKMKRKNA